MSDAAPEPDRRPTGAAAGSGPWRLAYHRSVAPMVWMLVTIGLVELTVTHLLLALWSRGAAVVLSLATAAGLAWLVRGLLTMRQRPVLLDGERLVMQVGTIRRIVLPLGAIAAVRTEIAAAALKQRSVLNMALLAYPNIRVDLAAPLPGRRGIVAIAHRLDDPAAFVATWKALGAQR